MQAKYNVGDEVKVVKGVYDKEHKEFLRINLPTFIIGQIGVIEAVDSNYINGQAPTDYRVRFYNNLRSLKLWIDEVNLCLTE